MIFKNRKSDNFAEPKEIKPNYNKIKEENESSKSLLMILNHFNISVYDLIPKIIGLILIILGLFFLFYFITQIPNLGISFIIVGIFSFFLAYKLENSKKNIIIRLIISERITIIFAIWIFISLFIIDKTDFRLFLVVVIIGFLIIREITKNITEVINKRMKIFLLAFFMIYLMIVVDTVATFLSQL